VSGRF